VIVKKSILLETEKILLGVKGTFDFVVFKNSIILFSIDRKQSIPPNSPKAIHPRKTFMTVQTGTWEWKTKIIPMPRPVRSHTAISVVNSLQGSE
jgi:hypothetical protein